LAPGVVHRPERGEEVYPLGAAAGASNLRHITLGGARLVLSGSMELDGKPHTIRVVWKRHAE